MKKYKVVLLGDSSVGKSSLIIRFILNQFFEYIESTLGSSFFHYVDNEKNIKLDIWDTAGQERFKALIPFYYRNVNVAIIVFDVQSPNTFHSAKEWVRKLSTEEPLAKIYLVGNKIDLPNIVSETEQEEYSKEKGLKFFRTSAKDDIGIKYIFEQIINEDIQQQEEKEKHIIVEEPKSGCCY